MIASLSAGVPILGQNSVRSVCFQAVRVLLRELDTRVSSVFRFTIASWLFPIVLGGIELHGRSAKGVWVSFAPLKTSC